MTIRTVTGNLAAAVATGGTFTVGYPTGTDRGSFSQGVAHKLSVIGKVFTAPENMTLSFGASSVTVTYNGTTTLPIGARFTFQFDQLGELNPVEYAGQQTHTPVHLGVLALGSPGVAAANNIFLSAALTLASGITTALTGALVAGGVAVMDSRCGRNVVAAWTGTAVLTVKGFDMYGVAMTESSASGTSFTGKKAFKRVTSISTSADITALTVGSGVVLGLPVYVPNAAMILKESQDGAAATAGTIVAGLTLATKPTATTADIRGTYNPNSAPDGSKTYDLLTALPDRSFLGAVQFA